MPNESVKNLHDILKQLIPVSVLYELSPFDPTLSGEQLNDIRAAIPLSGAEHSDIRNAVPKREIEYRIGRMLARKLLSQFKAPSDTSLPKKPNGAPNWPKEVIGSISHSESICIVAMTQEVLFSGIGIDIELGIFDLNLKPLIVRHEETLFCPGSLSSLAILRAIFCCKEALYKALERYLTERIDFLDVIILFSKSIDKPILTFNVKFTRSIPGLTGLNPEQICGNVYADEEMSVSFVTLKSK